MLVNVWPLVRGGLYAPGTSFQFIHCPTPCPTICFFLCHCLGVTLKAAFPFAASWPHRQSQTWLIALLGTVSDPFAA